MVTEGSLEQQAPQGLTYLSRKPEFGASGNPGTATTTLWVATKPRNQSLCLQLGGAGRDPSSRAPGLTSPLTSQAIRPQVLKTHAQE
jgi:molybdopterin biosynthesis enzyme